MKYLIDTNILLEILLNQARASESKDFLSRVPPEEVALSDFTLYSIGIRLFRHNHHATFAQMVQDLFVNTGFTLVRLPLEALSLLIGASTRYGLDFDDAYQYALAEHYDLVIVSFDSDFDITSRGRSEPSDL